MRLRKPGRHGARWDEAADAELRARFAAGELLPDVARAMNRSQEAVRTRANVLHIPVRSSIRRPHIEATVVAQPKVQPQVQVQVQAAMPPEAE